MTTGLRTLIRTTAKLQPAFATLAVGGLVIVAVGAGQGKVAGNTDTSLRFFTDPATPANAEVTSLPHFTQSTSSALTANSADSPKSSLSVSSNATPPTSQSASNTPSSEATFESQSNDNRTGSLDVSITTSNSGGGETQTSIESNTETTTTVDGETVTLKPNDDVRIEVRNEGTLDGSSHKTDVDIDRNVSVEQSNDTDLEEDLDDELNSGNNDVRNNENPVSVRNGSVKIDLKFGN